MKKEEHRSAVKSLGPTQDKAYSVKPKASAVYGRNHNRPPGFFSRKSAGALRRPPGTRFLWCSAHGDYASAGIRVYRGLSASRCMLAPRRVGPAPPVKTLVLLAAYQGCVYIYETVERLVAARIRRLVEIIKTFLTP